MSIKIHHGPHGSFKTSGAIKDDLIPAIRAGRPIVTNVRGITLDRIYEAIPDAPPDLDLHWIDTSTKAGRDKLSRFWHWAPNNSFFLIDEARSIFPKSWRQSDLDALNYPGGLDAASAEGRAFCWTDVWDMERHFNYDLVLTTPDIDFIRDDIRGNSEGAFKHKNKGIYGWLFKGSYVEGFHDPQLSGKAASHFQIISDKRIRKDDPTWKLYDSTATGSIRDTLAGINLLGSTRFLLPMGVFAFAVGFVLNSGVPDILSHKDKHQVSSSVSAVSSQARPAAAVSVSHQPLVPVATGAAPVGVEPVHPFEGQPWRLVAVVQKSNDRRWYFDIAGVYAPSTDLAELGYTFSFLTDCAVMVHHHKTHFLVMCQAAPQGRGAGAEQPQQAPVTPLSPESMGEPVGA